MKNFLVLFLVIANLFAYTQQTIYDVLNDDTYRTYGNKITAIEADSFKILNNSPDYLPRLSLCLHKHSVNSFQTNDMYIVILKTFAN